MMDFQPKLESVEDIFNTFADQGQMKIFKITAKNDTVANNSVKMNNFSTELVPCPVCNMEYTPYYLKKHILSKLTF